MSDVTTNGAGGVPSTELGDAIMRGVEDTRAGMTGNNAGKPFFRLLRNGEYVFGQNNEEVQKGSQWAINMLTLQRGWCCWSDGTLLGDVMDSLQVPRPPQPNPIQGQPFVEQYSMEMTCLTGDDAGQMVLYKNNSLGFKNAFADLMSQIRARYAVDKVHYWPIATFEKESYDHKKYGLIYNPIIKVVAWADAEGNIVGQTKPLAGPAKAATPAEPPKPARQRKAPLEAAQAEEAADEPQPTQQVHVGQRRRPSAR